MSVNLKEFKGAVLPLSLAHQELSGILGLPDSVVNAFIISFIAGEWVGMMSPQSERSRKLVALGLLAQSITVVLISYFSHDPLYGTIGLGFGTGFLTYTAGRALVRRWFNQRRH